MAFVFAALECWKEAYRSRWQAFQALKDQNTVFIRIGIQLELEPISNKHPS